MKNDIKRHPFRHVWGNVLSGILVILPLVTTLYVFIKLFSLADSVLPVLVHSFFQKAPKQWIPGFGIVVILVIAYFTGWLSKRYLGKKIIEIGNSVILSIPLLNKFYQGVQQIIDSFSGKKKFFSQPVLIEFPKPDSYCIAFLTSEDQWEISQKTEKELVSVFIPTTPNPTNGFLLFIPKQDVIRLNMNIEGGIKTIMSFGAVNPETMGKDQEKYNLPNSIKNWNWLNIFRPRRSGSNPFDADPRD